MLLITVAAVCFVVVSLYLIIGSWAYRKPWLLLVIGLLASAFSVLIKGTPQLLKVFQNLPWSSGELDLASSFVDPTLVGLAGGLLGSAFILKAQKLHSLELAEVRSELASALQLTKRVQEEREILRQTAKSLSNADFDAKLQALENLSDEALEKAYLAEERAKRIELDRENA